MDVYVDMLPKFNWYTVVSGATGLEQGDLLDDFPIIVPSIALAEMSGTPVGYEDEKDMSVDVFNVVVMTQSCDLARLDDEDEVILCPRYTLKELADREQKYRSKGIWKDLRAGRIIGEHIINHCELDGYEFDYQVIDLRRIFSVPLHLVERVAEAQGNRVRLLPPYREHLAQAFARRFMRIGLPIDIPSEFPY
jgi:hypothetical protein